LNRSQDQDPIWKALGDETRRSILDCLRDGPKVTTEIVELFPELSRFGVMKHLQVLRDTQLVLTRDEGRTTVNSLNAIPIRQVYERWVSNFADLWASPLLGLKSMMENPLQSEPTMSAQNPCCWFEIPVTDMARATAFYEKAFGYTMTPAEVEGIALTFFPSNQGEGWGVSGALVYTPPVVPSHNGSTVYFSVKSIEASLEKIVEAGGKVLIPKQSIGKFGFFAQFEDSEGNRVAVHTMSDAS
jgi:hypothetical protein